MIRTITDYSRPVDERSTLLVYRFNDDLKEMLADCITFETEDSNAAPEPSVGCRLRTDTDYEFTLIYAQASQQLIVFGELGADHHAATEAFVAEFPELIAHQTYSLNRDPDHVRDLASKG